MADPDIERVRRIVDKLARVRDRGLSCFGSSSHGFQLQDPLPPADLTAFEQRWGVRLPEDFRAFLLYAGRAGAGPDYGLTGTGYWRCSEDHQDDYPTEARLRRPSLLRPGRNPWVDEIDPDSPLDPHDDGLLGLGTRGCEYMTSLIITGEYRGRVVYLDEGNYASPYVSREPDFLSWYERWLDELLWGYAIGGFGYGPAGGESEFFAVLDDPRTDEELAAEAARAFCRLPSLSDAAGSRIIALTRHPTPGVRAGACASLRVHAVRRASSDVGALLADPDPGVREDAVRAALTLEPTRWTESVRRMLDEESHRTVAIAAFSLLNSTGGLSRADLVRLVENSPVEEVRSNAASHVGWTADDIGLLLSLLDTDRDPGVRWAAVLGLREHVGSEQLPALREVLSRETDPHVNSLLRVLVDRLAGSDGPSAKRPRRFT